MMSARLTFVQIESPTAVLPVNKAQTKVRYFCDGKLKERNKKEEKKTVYVYNVILERTHQRRDDTSVDHSSRKNS